MTIRFIIDERSIDLNGLNNLAGLDVIESILDRIEDARQAGHGVCFDEDLFNITLLADRTFWDLCDPNSPISLPREVSDRAAAVFGTMPKWHELDMPQPSDVDVRIDGGMVETTASVAWAHRQANGGLLSVACLCASGKRRTGAFDVEVAGKVNEVYFAASARDVEKFFRWLIVKHATNKDELSKLASSAFSDLTFIDDCFSGIKNMSKQFRQMLPDIVHHLSVLSDDGRRIYSGPWQSAPAEFGHLGVNISDENGNTKNNSVAKAERCKVVDGKTLCFWWHSKIEPHQDRIHIFPDYIRNNGKIIVGIFCLHLTV